MAPSGTRLGEGIRLQGLVKSFRSPQGMVHAVRGVDVAIASGETVALLGPNGAGKTTTIDMLLGLTTPDSGSVSLFGRPPSEAIKDGAIGAMLQTGSLIRDLSVRELITMMAGLYPAPLPVADVLGLVGLEPIADRRTQKLSGGETQRVRFAIALVSNPDLLVLDEPTVAMDVESRHAFWDTMRGFAARGKTIVFATHYLEEADANADRAVLMANGSIVADGPDHRDQGDGRPAHHPGDPARRRPRRARDGCRASTRQSGAARRSPSTAPTPTARSARSCRRIRRSATSRSQAPAWRRRSCSSPRGPSAS